MNFRTNTFKRKNSFFQAVQLTTENIREVGRELELAYDEQQNMIGPVPNITTVKHWYGFVGHWIVFIEGNFVIYHDDEFRHLYEPRREESKKEAILEILAAFSAAQDRAELRGNVFQFDSVSSKAAEKIMKLFS